MGGGIYTGGGIPTLTGSNGELHLCSLRLKRVMSTELLEGPCVMTCSVSKKKKLAASLAELQTLSALRGVGGGGGV